MNFISLTEERDFGYFQAYTMSSCFLLVPLPCANSPLKKYEGYIFTPNWALGLIILSLLWKASNSEKKEKSKETERKLGTSRFGFGNLLPNSSLGKDKVFSFDSLVKDKTSICHRITFYMSFYLSCFTFLYSSIFCNNSFFFVSTKKSVQLQNDLPGFSKQHIRRVNIKYFNREKKPK